MTASALVLPIPRFPFPLPHSPSGLSWPIHSNATNASGASGVPTGSASAMSSTPSKNQRSALELYAIGASALTH